MNIKFTSTGSLAFYCFVLGNYSFGQEITNIQNFLHEYNLNLKIIENSYEDLYADGTLVTETFSSSVPGVVKRGESSLEYWRSGKYTKLVRTGLNDNLNIPLSELVYVDEPRRLFIVERDVPAQAYRLNHLGDRKLDSINRMNSYINRYIKSSNYIVGAPVAELINSPGFSVRKLASSMTAEGGGIRVDFDYTPPPAGQSKSPWTTALSGWWIVDPAHGWVLREYRISKYGSPVSWYGRIEYSNELGETKLSKVYLDDGSTDSYGFKYEFTCKSFLRKQTPDKEFTLAAYGLGDAELPPGRSFNWSPYWFFGLAALAIVVSVILRRRAEQ